ncbi:MAG: hypothetical protein KC457_29305, partial [Myxococcales bacterium]|nr:hypothetical protein [Myxococcales bacterium]
LVVGGCKKKDEAAEAGDTAADGKDGADKSGDAAAKADDGKAAPEVPAEVEVPAANDGKAAAGSGGGGGGGGSGAAVPTDDREDLSCDPMEKGSCLEGETCIGAQGCETTWECDASLVCKKGVREYCGCDGRTFEAVYGNCPWKKYQYPGPCK